MRRVIVVLAATLLVVSSSMAQTRYVGGQEYQLIGGEWYSITDHGNYLVMDDVITVRYSVGTSYSAIESIEGINEIEAIRISSLGYYDYQLPTAANPLDVVEDMLSDPRIESADVNAWGKWVATPNDPGYTSQWYLSGYPDVWDIETGDDDVIIGVLDSGTDIDHIDLNLNIWMNPNEMLNGTDDESNGYVDDIYGWDFYNNNNDVNGIYYHGTHVAGIAVAETNNGTGVAGVAGGWSGIAGCKAMICGVGDNAPDPTALDDAIIYAVANGADILTMSLSLDREYPAVSSALYLAHNSGKFIDCASGNNYNSSLPYPANNPYVFAVGGTDANDLRASFSNYGSGLMLVAPATSIYSTRMNNTYGSGNGTSFSAPQAAGVAGLIWSRFPSLTRDEVVEVLCRSAKKVRTDIYTYSTPGTYGGWNNHMGYGLLHAFFAVAPPDNPTNLTTTGSTGQHPTLSWSPPSATDIKEYVIERKAFTTDRPPVQYPISPSLITVPGDETSWTDSEIYIQSYRPNWTVQYRVKAIDYTDQSSGFSNTVSTGTNIIPMGGGSGETIALHDQSLPTEFTLAQTSPNPFNAQTTIRFGLPSAGKVRLDLYDVTGRHVQTLLNGERGIGWHQVTWDAAEVPSGTYFLLARAKGQVWNRKLTVIK